MKHQERVPQLVHNGALPLEGDVRNHPDTSRATRLMTVAEAAFELHVSPRTLYRLVERRALPFRKIGGSTRFTREDVTSLIRSGLIEPRR